MINKVSDTWEGREARETSETRDTRETRDAKRRLSLSLFVFRIVSFYRGVNGPSIFVENNWLLRK